MNTTNLKFAIFGVGGAGGVIGGYLANAGNDVTFLARGAHLAAMQKDGLLKVAGKNLQILDLNRFEEYL